MTIFGNFLCQQQICCTTLPPGGAKYVHPLEIKPWPSYTILLLYLTKLNKNKVVKNVTECLLSLFLHNKWYWWRCWQILLLTEQKAHWQKNANFKIKIITKNKHCCNNSNPHTVHLTVQQLLREWVTVKKFWSF